MQEITQKTIEKTETENGKYFTHDHILEVRKRAGKELPIDLEYDPKIFWESVGEHFYKSMNKREQYQIGTSWLIDRLKVIKADTLLDCGTGFGRVLPFLIDSRVIKTATGIDIAENILKCSEEYLAPTDEVWCLHIKLNNGSWTMEDGIKVDDWAICPKCQIVKPKKSDKPAPDLRPFIKMKVGDVRKIDFESESFDCVLSFETLQHLKPEDVDDALREMVRVSKKSLICVERWAFPGERFEPHYFSHNISERLQAFGVDMAQVVALGNGLQGVICFKKIPK